MRSVLQGLIHRGAGPVLSACLFLCALPSSGQSLQLPDACGELAFSTSQDFVTTGPEPPDGNPIISDGDLLSTGGVVCARNADLLVVFDVDDDLGLDAVDVLDANRGTVAFSTELDSPTAGQFTSGDLLVTDGNVIPNIALTFAIAQGAIRYDLGLDAVHITGTDEDIVLFLDEARERSRADWLQAPGQLVEMLARHKLDIWFSTEGTPAPQTAPPFLDGDLLSAANGTIVSQNGALLPFTVPAGIPSRGVDFGLDAISADREGDLQTLSFSTELQYRGTPAYGDADVLGRGNGIVLSASLLLNGFAPKATPLGLDALHFAREPWPSLVIVIK